MTKGNHSNGGGVKRKQFCAQLLGTTISPTTATTTARYETLVKSLTKIFFDETHFLRQGRKHNSKLTELLKNGQDAILVEKQETILMMRKACFSNFAK